MPADSVVAIDTNIFIYHLNSDPQFGAAAKRLFRLIEDGEAQAIASAVSYSEIITLACRQGDDDLAEKYKELFSGFPHLEFMDVTIEVAHLGAVIRGKNNQLKLMDALILANAEHHKAALLVTEDVRLKRVKTPFPVYGLDQFWKKRGE